MQPLTRARWGNTAPWEAIPFSEYTSYVPGSLIKLPPKYSLLEPGLSVLTLC